MPRLVLLIFIAALPACTAGPAVVPEAETHPNAVFDTSSAADTAWTPLFNGRDLTGWTHVGRGGFVVEDGVLRTDGGMGLLWYTGGPFRDVVLRLVYRNPGGSNSGVFVRMPDPPAGVWVPVHQGYEVQIDDTDDDFHVTGVLYSMTEAKARPGRPEEWNTMEITLDGLRTVVTVNGVLVTDHTEGMPLRPKPWYMFWKFWAPKRGPRPETGYVGIQNHARRDTVYFREVSVRRLGGEIFFQAHRGAVDEAPENTLAALRHAWRFPGAVPEVDVRTTRDGALICLHDDTLGRTTDAPDSLARIDVARLSLEEVQRWDAGRWFAPRFAGEHVPTLADVFDLLQEEPDRRLYLDLKNTELDDIAALASEFGVQNQILFVHGDPEWLRVVQRRFPGAPTMTWLSGTPEEQRRRFEELADGGFAGISQLQLHLPVTAAEPEIRYTWSPEALKEAGDRLAVAGVTLQVRPFAFDATSLRTLLDAGIRWYVADAPQAFAQALKEARALR